MNKKTNAKQETTDSRKSDSRKSDSRKSYDYEVLRKHLQESKPNKDIISSAKALNDFLKKYKIDCKYKFNNNKEYPRVRITNVVMPKTLSKFLYTKAVEQDPKNEKISYNRLLAGLLRKQKMNVKIEKSILYLTTEKL